MCSPIPLPNLLLRHSTVKAPSGIHEIHDKKRLRFFYIHPFECNTLQVTRFFHPTRNFELEPLHHLL